MYRLPYTAAADSCLFPYIAVDCRLPRIIVISWGYVQRFILFYHARWLVTKLSSTSCKIQNTLFRCYGCTVHWAGELTGPCKMWRLKLKVNAHTHFIKLLSLWILPFLLGVRVCKRQYEYMTPLYLDSTSNPSYAYDRHTWVSYLHFIQTHSFDAPLSIIEKTRRFWTGTNTMKFSEMYNILHNSYGMSFMWL